METKQRTRHILAPAGRKRLLLGIVALTVVSSVSLARSAKAAPVTADGATIGSPAGAPSWGGFWRTGLEGSNPWGQYSVLTDGFKTYLNAPDSSGTIFFRGLNDGGANWVLDPDGGHSRMYLDSKSDLHVGGNIYAFGRADPSGSNDTFPGILAISRDTSEGVGVRGIATKAGLWGAATSSAGFGVVGTTGGPGWGGLFGSDIDDTYDNGIWAQGFVNAARFDGKVTINALDASHPGKLTVNGVAEKPGGGLWANTSDIRVKKDVVDFTLGLSDLEKIRVVKYKYNGLGNTENTGKEYVGVVAQELERVFPFMVFTQVGKLHPGDAKDTDIKMVDGSAFTFVLVNAVRELSSTNKDQNAKLTVLAEKNEKLAQENARLAAQYREQSAKLAELTETSKAIAAQNAQLLVLAEQNKKLVALVQRKLGIRTLASSR